MAIAEPLSLPDQRFAQVSLNRRSAVALNRSPFTLDEQVYAWPGQLWVAQIRVVRLHTRARAAPWRSFLGQLNGRQRRFLMGDPLYEAPRGSGAGTPVLDGAHATRAQALQTRGWTVGAAGVLLAGDLLQLGSGVDSRLHEVLTDVDADGAGEAAVEVWPGLRADYADGTGLTLDDPKGIWRMQSNDQGHEVRPPSVHQIAFTAVEAF